MAQIVTLTGIKAHTLRKWESRYSFLEPERTDTNIRYYSDIQLKKLLNIGVLTRHGYRISKIDKMSDDEIFNTITNSLPNSNKDDGVSALIISMLDLDEVAFNDILKTQIIKKGLLATTVELIYPFLNQVGVLWGLDKVMPAQEHFVSNLIKKKIFSAIDILPYPKKDASSIVMFLPENEFHETGLLLAYYIARELGWRVYYLGQNVPIKNIEPILKATNPKVMLTMFVTPMLNSVESTINNILTQGNVPLFFSGNILNIDDVVKKEKVIHLFSPDDFMNRLKEM